MASKKSNRVGSANNAEGSFNFLKEIFSNVILSNIVEFVKSSIRHFQDAVYHTTKKVIESFLAMFIMIIGVAMVVLALPFLLSHYLELPASLFFILIGVILILISLYSFDRIHKSKYK